MYIVDAHLDLAYNALLCKRDIRKPAAELPLSKTDIATVGLPDLRRGNVAFVCATIFASPKSFDGDAGYSTPDEAQVAGWEQLQYYLDLLKQREIDLITSPDEVPTQPCGDGPLPCIILMEGADPLRTPDDLDMWFNAGLRIIGPAWKQTRYAGGTSMPGPLTKLGRELIPKMDELGLIHDTSHLAEESFWEVMDLSTGPIFASHSNARAIVPTDRQLSDEMILALVKRGGVIGINFYDKFLLPPSEFRTRKASAKDLHAHIDHITQLAGSPNYVGLGTDMDGGLGREQIPQEVTTSADLPKLADALRHLGYPDEAIAGILGQNFARFFKASLPTRHRAS